MEVERYYCRGCHKLVSDGGATPSSRICTRSGCRYHGQSLDLVLYCTQCHLYYPPSKVHYHYIPGVGPIPIRTRRDPGARWQGAPAESIPDVRKEIRRGEHREETYYYCQGCLEMRPEGVQNDATETCTREGCHFFGRPMTRIMHCSTCRAYYPPGRAPYHFHHGALYHQGTIRRSATGAHLGTKAMT